MPTPLDVEGTMPQKMVLIIGAIIVVGLVLAFTPLRVIGYILLATGAALYVFTSVSGLVQALK